MRPGTAGSRPGAPGRGHGGLAFGGGGLLGALAAGLVNLILVGTAGVEVFLRRMGLSGDPGAVRLGLMVGTCLWGLLALFLAVGAGALVRPGGRGTAA